jgi:DNA-binding NtrC family response regulator
MRPPKILLLDFCFSQKLSESLLSLLSPSASATSVSVELQDGDFVLDSTKAHGDFDLVFVLLAPALVSRASQLLQQIKSQFPATPLAVVLETEEPEGLLDLARSGADEFFAPPLRSLDVLPRVLRLIERADPEEALVECVKARVGLKQLVGQSQAFREQTAKIPQVAKFNSIVLILGETGTGKELCARAIHYLSPRANKPFVPINCGAIPVDLVENELFGHVRGAFTGAATARRGLIEEAEGGTLFLDEVDCLPLLAQVKLLRFLQEKEFRPLGSAKMRQANVRVIAAANSNLEEAVKSGRLRQDLFYRLNIVPIELPPLRERTEDIPALVRHFLRRYAMEFEKDVTAVAPEALHQLMVHNWPGNIRELEHVIERAVILTQSSTVQLKDLVLSRQDNLRPRESLRQAKAKVVEKFEKTYIQALLVACNGNITKAAEAAQKNRRAFWQLIRRHRIDVQRFKSQES